MESINNSQLLVYLEDHRLINNGQYGFHHGCSTGDLLVYLIHRWTATIESKGEGLAVSLDMAFDRMCSILWTSREFMQVDRQFSLWA